MSWRKITWASILWNALWIVLFVLWAMNPELAGASSGGGVTTAPVALLGKPADWELFDAWFIGLVAMSIIWLVTRPRNNVAVYGPEGQLATVSKTEARRRVETQGWTYEKPARRQVTDS